MQKKLVFENFDQASLDYQYNNRKRVPDVEKLYNSWIEPGQNIINKFNAKLNIPYGSGERQKLDFLLPKAKGLSPVNLYFHGGFWMSRSKSDQTFIAKPFVEAGAAFGLIEYNLMPNTRIADIVEECRAAVFWVSQNAEQFNIDPNRIFVSGHSAGGHLATMVAATDWAGSGGVENLIKGVCAISGIYDLKPIKASYIQETLCFTDSEVLEYSPVLFDIVPRMPVIIGVGNNESHEFYRQSKDMVDAWNFKGAQCKLVVIPKCNHFTVLSHLAEPKSLLAKAVLAQMGLSEMG